ncbi:TPA: MFS transporter [Clostridioides difficile]|nr:MFS transporter [Clostridioides difficile]
MLLRASIGMGIVIFTMAFVQNVYQLLGLRILQGVFTGYATACTTLIATQTDKNHSGWAWGTLATASTTGSLIGPTVGGYIESILGLKSTFIITGGLLFVSFIISILFVVDNFKPKEIKESISIPKEQLNILPNKFLIASIFVTTFITQLALYSIEPIVTIYISQLTNFASNVALIAGLTFSASGLANLLAAQKLGKMSDKIGPQKVLLISLLWAGIIFIPQAFVKTAWQLMWLRFLLGLSVAGLNPSVNSLLKKIAPEEYVGKIFGYNASAQYIGCSSGAFLGGQISAHLGIRTVFFSTSLLLFRNALWMYKFTGLFIKDKTK